MSPSILLDDSALTTNLDLLGNTWTRQTGQTGVYNGTLTQWNPDAQSLVPPELYFFWYGADINFYGTMTSGLAANYTIDGTTRRPVPFPTGVTNDKTGINLFSLSNLTDGASHLLNIFPSAGQFTIDYVTYTPNTYTTLLGVDLILDDNDSELKYSSGQWNHTTGDFNQGRPYAGTLTGSNTQGATMQLSFVGSDISVYGLLNQVSGRLSASFAVDGQPATNYTPFNGDQDTNPSTWLLSQQFFHKDLTPGQHTLLVTLNNVSDSQMLWIDSVVFQGTSSTTLTSSSSSGSGGTSLGSGTQSRPAFPYAAIGGIAAGALIVVVIVALVLFRWVSRCIRWVWGCITPDTRTTTRLVRTTHRTTSLSTTQLYNTPARNNASYNPYPPLSPPPPQQDGANSNRNRNHPPARGPRAAAVRAQYGRYNPNLNPAAAARPQQDGAGPGQAPAARDPTLNRAQEDGRDD